MQESFFSKTNIALVVISIGVIVLGFFLLSSGPKDGFTSLTLSPLVLTFGYLVAVPLAILWSGKNKAN